MKTYYIIKAYAANNRTREERFHYFGKQNKLLGWICDDPIGVHRYSKDDIRKHGYVSFPKAKAAAAQLASEDREPGWTVVITLIAEAIAI